MIQETCTVINELAEQAEAETRARYARRNRIRYIDDLINEFEMLNLAEEPVVPRELHTRVVHLVAGAAHPIVAKNAADALRIADWMEALYDLQDTLMITFEDDVD